MNKNFQSLILEFLFFAIMIFTVYEFWDNTLYSTIIGIVLVIIALLFFHTKEDLVFFWTGALLGTGAEIVCIYYGAWNYSNPVILGIPLWLPIFWGFASLFVRRLRDTVYKLEHIDIHYKHNEDLPLSYLILIYDIFLFGLSIVFISLLWRTNILLLIILLVLFWLTTHNFHKKEDLFFVSMAAIVGPIAEIICINAGAWYYSNPSIFGIPSWLPVAYAILGLVLRRTVSTIIRLIYKKPKFDNKSY